MKALLFLTLFVAVFAQKKSFKASFVIRNDPNIRGNMNGTINYDNEGTAQKIRMDYILPGGAINELLDYANDLRYLRCTICETSTTNAQMPIYYQGTGATGGSSSTVNGIAVKVWNIPNNPVSKVYISDATGDIIKADFILENGATVAKTIEFSGHQAVDRNQFVIDSWACPPRKCTKMMDIMLVFDESGSIQAPDFRKELDFGAALADNYNFGADSAQMGFVQFDDDARLTAPLTAIKSNFVNLVRAASQGKGRTCTACGMMIAYNELVGPRGRAKAGKVMITLTDGQSNENFQGRNLVAVATEIKGKNVFSFGIGVGPDVVPAEINTIASNIAGVTTSYPAIPNFTALKAITEQLVVATCVDIPGTPCGAGCRGFCSCQGKCVCPSNCDDNDPCTVEGCSESVNGAGCFYSNTCNPGSKCISVAVPAGEICEDFNACTNDTCDPTVGCTHQNVTCPRKLKCIDAFCNTALGCQEKNTDCLIANPRLADIIKTCYTVECNEEKGCHINPIDGAGFDDCGVCNGTNACKNPLPTELPYALTGGALAAVLVFAIVAAAALGAAGGKAGYNVWMNHRNHISGAQTSPLYTDSGLTGASPLYKA